MFHNIAITDVALVFQIHILCAQEWKEVHLFSKFVTFLRCPFAADNKLLLQINSTDTTLRAVRNEFALHLVKHSPHKKSV
jgi:hypothetical protein